MSQAIPLALGPEGPLGFLPRPFVLAYELEFEEAVSGSERSEEDSSETGASARRAFFAGGEAVAFL
jgi:hypothetical protein